MTDTPNKSKVTRGRTLLGIAAAVVVAVGVTAVVMNRDDSDNDSVPATDPAIDETTTTGVPRADSFIADASLLTEADLGSPWVAGPLGFSYIDELLLQRSLPECAEQLASTGDAAQTAKSAGRRFVVEPDQFLIQQVIVFPSAQEAAALLDVFAAQTNRACGLATGAAIWGGAVGDDNASASTIDVSEPAEHGDQQLSFGAQTTYGGTVQISQLVWVQVDRALVRITVGNTAPGATDPDPLGILEAALDAAVTSVTAELAAG